MHVEFRFADAFKTNAYTIVRIVRARLCLCHVCESLYACVCVRACVCRGVSARSFVGVTADFAFVFQVLRNAFFVRMLFSLRIPSKTLSNPT